MEIDSWKTKCIALLSRNVITDFSNPSQLKSIGITANQLNSRYQLSIEGAKRDVKNFHNGTKKAGNRVSGKTFLKKAEAFVYADMNERNSKMIYVHISSQDQLSEMSFLVKFWDLVIEFFFNPNQYFVQWGGTVSPHLSLSNLQLKLDFRVIVKDFENTELDVVTGELASHSSTNPAKLYKDFLKSALTTKTHLNAALRKMPYIPPNKIKTVVAPMVQIMGLSCIVYGMNIIDKKVYTLQTLCSFNYPSTLREIKNGGISALLDGFGLIESMIENIEAMIAEYSRTPVNEMSNIKKGRKKTTAAFKTTDIDEYISNGTECRDDNENEEQEYDEPEDEE